MGGSILDCVVWEGLPEEVAFALRSEGRRSWSWEDPPRLCREEDTARAKVQRWGHGARMAQEARWLQGRPGGAGGACRGRQVGGPRLPATAVPWRKWSDSWGVMRWS